MPAAIEIHLTQDQRRELETVRDHHEKPYMRERAAAILKITEGMSGLQVSTNGLLKSRDPDTIYEWVHRWEQAGMAGLRIRPGRGRKPAFSPSG